MDHRGFRQSIRVHRITDLFTEWKRQASRGTNVFKSSWNHLFDIKPYLSFLHSVLSFPLGVLYFVIIWSGLFIGGGTLIFGIGIVILLFTGIVIRVMIYVEVFLAQLLLKMNIVVSHFESLSAQDEQLYDKEDEYSITAVNNEQDPSDITVMRQLKIPVRVSWRDLTRSWFYRLRDFLLNGEFGSGMLYSIVKLPVCTITAGVSLLFFVLPLYGIASPIVYGICGQSLCNTNGENYSWYWITFIMRNLVGSIIASVVSILCIPISILVWGKISQLSKNAVMIIAMVPGEYDETFEDDE